MSSDPSDAGPSWIDEIPDRLAALDAAHLTRRRREVRPAEGASLWVDGRRMLAFCSNDYLGLSQHEALRDAAIQGARDFGVGSGASPMVSGHSEANAALERELAEFVGLERALYFYAGYATNASIVPALVGPGDALFSDALNHACLIDGARLSKADIHRFEHADLAQLESLLQASPARRKLVISDAVFSMDGDVADIPALIALCERHDALLLLDDAHGFGVCGPQGRGSLAAVARTGAGASRRVIYMATLGKAAGVSGAFVAGPATLVEWLLQKTRSYTFATAAPALLAQSVRAALRVIRDEPARLARLHRNIADFRAGLPAAIAGTGWTLLPSATAVQALVIGANDEALRIMNALADAGLWVPAIRPPTVPEGTARLRIALSAAHEPEDIAALLRALADAAQRR
ncbi:8-amino-7-oxononanoate synthase [Scleromatobacter humisilvae]|uniref:8-amino-7-oxononanoate synthase n=1 Tax=Scleromatobacter humisilvae TaxID=2897159 RepID=A0A9X1YFQ1_9BURK|nr:8-amino-7-oxononanoate synthase [Scleromatobacter humisilvae]MCK9684630.1 8-amino-7-oxononanoate synthase [Scleromatobacter humisilvae]